MTQKPNKNKTIKVCQTQPTNSIGNNSLLKTTASTYHGEAQVSRKQPKSFVAYLEDREQTIIWNTEKRNSSNISPTHFDIGICLCKYIIKLRVRQ